MFLHVYYSQSGSGKTIMSIGWVKERKTRILIVLSFDEKRRIIETFCKEELESGLVIPLPEWTQRIVTMDEYLQKNHPLHIINHEIGIDNVDMILDKIFKNPVTFITATEPEECVNEFDDM